jgi:hypothetical protein
MSTHSFILNNYNEVLLALSTLFIDENEKKIIIFARSSDKYVHGACPELDEESLSNHAAIAIFQSGNSTALQKVVVEIAASSLRGSGVGIPRKDGIGKHSGGHSLLYDN